MQFYSGPSRRVLRRYKDNSGFKIDGIVDQEEERGLFVKQSFTLQQFRDTQDPEGYYDMGNYWLFPHEVDFDIPVGGRVPFQQDHTITDRLLLNKSFNNVVFQPENCHNFLKIDTKSQTRLAPLLCAHTTYTNVTRLPRITTDATGRVQPNVPVQMGEYNRLWFGAVEDMSTHAQVTNRQGLAPYTVGDVNANITYVAGHHPQIGDGNAPGQAAVGNREIYTAYGFQPANLPTPQALRANTENIMIGELGTVHGSTAGIIDWLYDEVNDVYYSNSFTVTIPFPLNQNVTTHTFTVPRMQTLSVSDERPFNYFFTGDSVESNPRNSAPAVAVINVAAGPAHVNETRNTYDFVRVKMDRVAGSYVGDIVVRDIFMFVPAFRIVKGNVYRSIARPRRYAASSATTRLQPWLPNNATPMSALVGAGTDLTSQVPFWSNFQNLRGEEQHVVVVGDDGYAHNKKLFDYVKVGHLALDDTLPALITAAVAAVATQQGLYDAAILLIVGLLADPVNNAAAIVVQEGIVAEATIQIYGLDNVVDSEEIGQQQAIISNALIALQGLNAPIDNAAIAVQQGIITAAQSRLYGVDHNEYRFDDIAIQQAIIVAAQAVLDGPPALQEPDDHAEILVQQGIIGVAQAIIDGVNGVVGPFQVQIADAQRLLNGLDVVDDNAALVVQQTARDNALAARGVAQATIDAHPGTDNNPMFVLQMMAQADLPAAFQTQLDVMAAAAVTNRGVNAIAASEKEVMFLYKDTATNYYGYFRVKLDQLNTFRAANGDFNGDRFGNKIPAAGHAAFRAALWAKRQFQIELLTARNGKYLKENVSPFRSEDAYELGFRLADGNQRAAAITAANTTSETFEGHKPFDLRSTYNFMGNGYTYGAAGDRPALEVPQREMNGTLTAENRAFYDDNRFELFLPVQREVPNTLVRPHTVTVECCEPFFGYCSGSSQLECQHPMDTRRLGKNYPIILQDMGYTYRRDAQPILTRGYRSDQNTTLKITSTTDPTFTTISEKMPGVSQHNKEVMTIAEITPTFDAYSTYFSDAPGVETIPTIEIEARSGMFEYLFMWIEYPLQSEAIFTHYPDSDPVIESLRFKVRGRENLFVRQLDEDDLERLSRENCHKLCLWREWHESGQGILLSLADIGLTEEIAYPQRKRIQLEITCLKKKNPAQVYDGANRLALPENLQFNVVIVRRNQLFKGDFTGTRFVFLNENI